MGLRKGDLFHDGNRRVSSASRDLIRQNGLFRAQGSGRDKPAGRWPRRPRSFCAARQAAPTGRVLPHGWAS